MRAIILALLMLVPVAANAQDATLDDKLRDLLRQTTTQLRAAEDNTATLQASLDSMTKERDALQQQLAVAQAKPVAPSVPPEQPAALQQAQARLAAAQAHNAQAAIAAQRLQAAYQNAAGIARDKDAADRRSSASLKQALATLGTCKAANAKLIDTAEDILHLYETPQFRSLLVASHERLIGFKRVQLENLVQDYDDKIAAQSLIDAPEAASR